MTNLAAVPTASVITTRRRRERHGVASAGSERAVSATLVVRRVCLTPNIIVIWRPLHPASTNRPRANSYGDTVVDSIPIARQPCTRVSATHF
jgi:hypothetical protein